jgi:general stress protein YciG
LVERSTNEFHCKCPIWGAKNREAGMADEVKKKGAMSVSEAGRKGGQTVRDKYGHSFYEEIGKKGGETVKAERGRAFYEQIGKKGGDTVKAERGAGFYETIGKKGGEAVKAERGTPFYEEIGKKGGHRVRTLIEEGKKAASEAAAARSAETARDNAPAIGGEVMTNDIEPKHE